MTRTSPSTCPAMAAAAVRPEGPPPTIATATCCSVIADRSAMTEQHVAVAIVGGGPSGLTAAAAMAGQVDGEVLVIEREAETGGIPRHSDHLGYGIRDLKRFISGPAYARRLTATAQDAGATL